MILILPHLVSPSLVSATDTLHVDQCECFSSSATDSKPRHGPIGSYPLPLHILPFDRGMPKIVPDKHSFDYVQTFICIYSNVRLYMFRTIQTNVSLASAYSMMHLIGRNTFKHSLVLAQTYVSLSVPGSYHWHGSCNARTCATHLFTRTDIDRTVYII